MKNKRIVVWFSCGAASAVAAKLTIEKYGKNNEIMIVNNPIKEEDSDNIRFKDDVSKWIGHEIIEAKNKDYPNASIVEIFEKRKYMGGIAGAPCTMLLKKEARYQFELEHEIDWHVLGFTIDEQSRHERFVKGERANTIPVLIDAGYTKTMCFDKLVSEGIKLPAMYSHYPNANCPVALKLRHLLTGILLDVFILNLLKVEQFKAGKLVQNWSGIKENEYIWMNCHMMQ